MKKPVPEEFGLTSQEYTHLRAERTRLREALDRPPKYGHWFEALVEALMLSLVVAFYYFLFGGIVGVVVGVILEKVFGLQDVLPACAFVGAIIGASCAIIVIVDALTEPYSERKKRTRYRKQLLDPKYHKVAQYEEATRRYEYRQQTYWKSLKGTKFERTLARLYTNMGYLVSQTKGSGDEGIDLILLKDDKKTVVQCKGLQKPVGIGAVRDLYGTMMHFAAENAVLACPAGFTKAVRKFAMGKSIQLISATDLVKMAESIDEDPTKNNK